MGRQPRDSIVCKEKNFICWCINPVVFSEAWRVTAVIPAHTHSIPRHHSILIAEKLRSSFQNNFVIKHRGILQRAPSASWNPRVGQNVVQVCLITVKGFTVEILCAPSPTPPPGTNWDIPDLI